MNNSTYIETCSDCEGEGSCGTVHKLTGVACTRGAACDGHHVACTSAHRVHRWSTVEAPPRVPGAPREPSTRSGSAEGRARREKLLESLRRAAVPVGEWCRANGFDEKLVRGDIGSLRKAGHNIKAIGAGRFALDLTAHPEETR